MLQKYLQKKAESLKQHTSLAELIRKTIRKGGSAYESRIDSVNVQLVCNQFLNFAEKLLVSKKFPLIKQILYLVNNLLLEIHNDQIYELYIIKIRQFLLSLEIAKQNQSQYLEKQKRITFFLKKIENTQFYSLLQEDFYSSLQLVYIEATKIQLASGNPIEALKSLKSAFQSLKKQIITLTDYSNLNCSEKLNNLLQKKKRTLQVIFYLEYGANVCNSIIISDKLSEQLLSKYQKLFHKMVLNFQSKQLISQAIKNLEVQNEQDQNEQDFQQERQVVQRNSIVSNSLSQQSSSKGLQSYIRINSINVIQNPIRKNSLQVQSRKSSKISIRFQSNPIIHEENFQIQKSRFCNTNQNIIKTSTHGHSKLFKGIESTIKDQRSSESKSKSMKQYRTRKFSIVTRQQQKDKQRIKKLKIDWNEMEKLEVSKRQMLKTGIILV